jgi:hypothetical protein
VKDTIAACASGGCTALNYDLTQSFYTPATSIDTDTIVPSPASSPSFTRIVKLAPVANNASEENLTVTVSWKDSGSNVRSVVVHENITNWQ